VKPVYMLDTDICIYIAKRQPPGVRARFEQLKPGQLIMSSITFGELCYGLNKSTQRTRALARLEELIQEIPVEDLNRNAAMTYGEIRAHLAKAGVLIGSNDLWIAAHAKALGVTLATNNEREFRRVPGLTVENWAS